MKRLLVLCALFLMLPGLVKADEAAAPTYISEIAWAGSIASNADEWLEVCGTPGTDLSDWSIAGAAIDGTTITLPQGASLGSSGSYLVANFGPEEARSTLAVTPDLATTALSLSNSDLFLELRAADGSATDVAGASGTAPFAGRTGDAKASMERVWPVTDGSRPDAWVTATLSLGFDDGAKELGTPGTCIKDAVPTSTDGQSQASATSTSIGTPLAQVGDVSSAVFSATETDESASLASAHDSAPAPTDATGTLPLGPLAAVRISEFFPWPKTGDQEWVELVDLSDHAEDLTGWTIEDAKGTPTDLSGTLAGWGRAVIESPRGQLNNAGDLVVLKDAAGRILDAVAFGNFLSPLYPNAGRVRQGEAVMRMPSQAAFVITTHPTPGAENILADRAPVMRAAVSAPETPVSTASPLAPAAVPTPAVPVTMFPGSPAMVTLPADPIPETEPAPLPSLPAQTASPPVRKVAMQPTRTQARYKGESIMAIVAAPPNVYSKVRWFGLVDDALREMRLAKPMKDVFSAGQRVAFIAQEKTDVGGDYLLTNPNSIHAFTASASATFATVEAWPDDPGFYRFNAEVMGVADGIIAARLGDVEGDIVATKSLTASLKPGDIVAFEGAVMPGDRPKAVLARKDALTLFKAYVSPPPPKKAKPAMKLPWPAAVVLIFLMAVIGLFIHLRRERLKRFAVTAPIDEDEEM